MSTLSSQLDGLYELEQAQKQAEAAVLAKANEIFPVGALVWFEKFGGQIEAEVTCLSFHRTRIVRNVVTGKEYRIELYDLTREHYRTKKGN